MSQARQGDIPAAPAKRAAPLAANDQAADDQAADDRAAAGHVHALVTRSGSSFLWGMRVMPKHRREAMYAIYAFCRAIDDIADEPGERMAKLTQLDDWRGEIERLYRGRPEKPIARALRRPVEEFALPKDEFLALIDGMEMDVNDRIQAPSQEDFRLYCRRVAGAVGMLSVRIFGETSPAAEELAVTLGEALQTTNILRDLAEDAKRGRLYLPRDVLARHGITERAPDAVLTHPALPTVCAELAERSRDCFTRARGLLVHCNRRRVRPAILMLEAYDRILRRLEARGWDRPETPVRLSRLEKLWIALRHSLA